MTLRFDEPAWFWALLLIAPMALSWILMGRIVASRRALAILLRLAAVACVVAALARPQLLSTQSSLAVVGVLDVSGSVARFSPTPPARIAEAFLRAAERRGGDDRVGLVTFDSSARALLVPTSAPARLDLVETTSLSGTALAEGVALASALVPAGEAGRVVVMSDGLETIGRAASLAGIDRGRIAVDTVLLPLEPLPDVSIESLDVPAAALPRAPISAMVTLRTDAPTTGVLRLRMDDRLLQLAGEGAEGDGMRLTLEPGATRVRVSVPLGDGPVHQLDAIFEADDPALDRIAENSSARRVVAVPAGRSVLVLGEENGGDLDAALVDAGFQLRRMPADALPEDPLWLAGFDLVVLDDLPAAAVSASQQRMLADHVQRLGGGLLCIGGPSTFGAGGWRGSMLSELLPVDVEPPTEDRRHRAALVFLIDRSGSMRQPVAGTRSTQQQVANEAAALAIESIASRALVGVIAFDNRPSVIVPLAPMDDPSAVAARVQRIAPDGGTAIGAALRASLDALEPVRGVEQKLVILLTDGVGFDDDVLREQTARAARAGVTVTTISIGDATDDALLAWVAEQTGGVFHPVRNPRVLPRVLVDSVQSINRPLVREGVITVQARGDSDLARAVENAPALRGVTVLGRTRSADSIVDASTDLGEPLVARWPAGVGRVALFASDSGRAWSRPWSAWRGRTDFWERMARWAARAPGSAPVAAEARIEDGRFTVTIEAAAADAISGSIVDGLVRAPDGRRLPFELRRVAPRRFSGSIDAEDAGAWLAVISPRGEHGPLPPILAAAVAPEGIEFARQTPDPAPLEALRNASGGREIPLESLASTDLFLRDGLRLGMRERPLAPWLLFAAALLFTTDAAVRRLAVRRQLVREALHIATAPAESTGRLAASRRPGAIAAASAPRTAQSPAPHPAVASAPVAGATAVASSSSTARSDGRPAAASPATTERGRAEEERPQPSADEVRAALEALRTSGAPPQPSHAPADPPQDEAEDASGSASIEALRRARDRSRIFPP